MWNDGWMRGDVVPRDDRAWPRSSSWLSVALTVVAVGSGVGLVLGAAGRGLPATASVAAGLVVAFAFGLAVSIPAMRLWIAGQPVPARFTLLQCAGLVAAFAVLGLFDVLVGWAMVAGLLAGLLVANIWGIRTARANRDLVDRAEAAAVRDQAPASGGATGPFAPDAVAGPDAPVEHVLRDTMAVERRRSVGWLVAGVLGLAACGVLGAPDRVTFVVFLTAGLAFLWVLRRLWFAWLALRSFTTAATQPRRAFVVLLYDPAPRLIRPLLGVWSAAPVPRGGRLPKPERVYRCDEELTALACHQGSVVVHEAWVGAGPGRWARPRWVAADAGMALPHRRAVFGRWYLSNLLSDARPGQPRPLTLRQPHPGSAVIVESGERGGSYLAAVAGRLAVLAAVGLLFYWLT